MGSLRPTPLARQLGLVATFILVIFVASPEARAGQTPAFAAGARAAAPPAATGIDLLVGRSTVLNVDRPIERVSLTTPDIADALVTAPQQILIHGKTPGTISLFVWDRAGGITSYEVSVRRDLSALAEQMRQLFPGEPVAVAGNGKDVVLSGTVTSKYVVEKAADVAGGYVDKKENVVNLLRQQEGVASNQVMLRVRFAEVSRNAMQELGVSFFTGAGGHRSYVGRMTTQQFPGPDFDAEKGLVFSDFLNFLLFNNKEQLGAVVKALSEKGLFQSLAEPNLVAQNGKDASFLAGGEFPFPVVQSSAAGNAVTIQFKEFGIRLSFTPTILQGDLIHLKVRPEVSALDFQNAVTIEGFRVPALSTRRIETDVELRDGQTFAIAGLMNNTVSETMRKIPGIGDIPVLGLLFRSRAHQKQQTELVVMITPVILKRDSTGVASGLPGLVTPFLPPATNPMPPPPPYAPKGEEQAGLKSGATTTPAEPDVARDFSRATVQTDTGSVRLQPDAPPTPAASTGGGRLQPARTPVPSLSKTEREQLEAQRKAEAKRIAAEAERAKEDAKRAAEDTKRAEEAARRAAEQAAKDRKRQDTIAREQAKRDAEAAKRAVAEADTLRQREEKLARARAKQETESAKRAGEIAKKREKEEQERAKVLAEADARLRAAQSKYQAEVKKQTKPGGESTIKE